MKGTRVLFFTTALLMSLSSFASTNKLAETLIITDNPFRVITEAYKKAKPVALGVAIKPCIEDRLTVEPGYRETTLIMKETTEVMKAEVLYCVRVIESTNVPPLFPVRSTIAHLNTGFLGQSASYWDWEIEDYELVDSNFIRTSQVENQLMYTTSTFVKKAESATSCEGWSHTSKSIRELDGNFIIKNDFSCDKNPKLNFVYYVYRFKI